MLLRGVVGAGRGAAVRGDACRGAADRGAADRGAVVREIFRNHEEQRAAGRGGGGGGGAAGRGAENIMKCCREDNGFEPIRWKYECQGLHLSESANEQSEYILER